MTRLERDALAAWQRWGSAWSMKTTCSCCGEVKQCRGKRRSRMICLDCWDQKGGRA